MGIGGAVASPASPPAAAGLRIGLLGGFRVVAGGRPVEEGAWRLRKAKALVKLLAPAPDHRPHREHVQDLLWSDLDPEAAANNLKQAVHWARRALAADGSGAATGALRVQDDLLTLAPGDAVWTDVAAFEAAAAQARRTHDPAAYQTAVGLYGGDLLPEDRYEDWAAVRRDALRGLYLALLAELAGLHEAQGDFMGASEAWQRLVAAEPAQEPAHAALMRLYALSGQRPQALRQYQLLREALKRDLDAKPEATSQRLYQDILTGRFPGGRPGWTTPRGAGRAGASSAARTGGASGARCTAAGDTQRRTSAAQPARAGDQLRRPRAGAGRGVGTARHDNLRAALDWSLRDGAAPLATEQALRLVGALAYFGFLRVQDREGRAWLEPVMN